MPVKSITITDTYVELNDDGNILHFDFADFPPSADTNEARQAHVVAHAQDWLDTRIPVKDLPADDPLAISDPALPYLFWEGTGGNKVVVVRNIVIENVNYDSSLVPPLSLTLRRIWPP